MPCEFVPFPNGYAIICGPRRKQQKCFYCEKPSSWLCDLPIGLPVGLDPSEQGVCDRPICSDHRLQRGANIDWCAIHHGLPVPEKHEFQPPINI